jgi:hypothetical protein
MTIPDWVTGAGAALVASAAVRALPRPPAAPQGFMWVYVWFYQFTQTLLANFDKSFGK